MSDMEDASAVEAELEAAMDAMEFRDEDDWLAPPLEGYGFFRYCPIRFLAYLRKFGPEIGEGTPLDLPFDDWGYHGRSTYFARGKVTGRIKIGVSRSPEYRVSQLQFCTNGEPATPLVIVPTNVEKTYHRAFRRWHEGHEWFAPHPDLIAEIDRLTDTFKDKDL